MLQSCLVVDGKTAKDPVILLDAQCITARNLDVASESISDCRLSRLGDVRRPTAGDFCHSGDTDPRVLEGDDSLKPA